MSKLIISVTTATNDDAEQFATVYKAPSNYGEAKAKEYLDKKNEEWLEKKAPFDAFAAEIAVVSMYNPETKTAKHLVNADAVSVDAEMDISFVPNAEVHETEICLLTRLAENILPNYFQLIGSALNTFHLPMIIRRSAKYQISIPDQFKPHPRYFDRTRCFDTFEAWGLGTPDYVSAKNLALYFGYTTPKMFTEGETMLSRLAHDNEATLADIEEGLSILADIADDLDYMTGSEAQIVT